MNSGNEKKPPGDTGGGVESASSLKPSGKMCQIREQILRDDVTGLTLQFEVDGSGCTRLTIYGEALEFGNRELGFEDGKFSFAGTFVGAKCKPAWMMPVDDL